VAALDAQLGGARAELRDAARRAAEARDTSEFKVLEAASLAKQLQVGWPGGGGTGVAGAGGCMCCMTCRKPAGC
jgi:hypothetical protein